MNDDVSELDIARLRLGDLEFRVDKYIEENLQEWAEFIILDLAQKKAYAKGLSDSVLASMYITMTGPTSFSLIWDYRGPNNEPISLWLEKGTIPHDIPKAGNFGAKTLTWIGKDGKRVFRRRVKHPGTKPMWICRDAIKEGKPKLLSYIKKQVENYLRADRIG